MRRNGTVNTVLLACCACAVAIRCWQAVDRARIPFQIDYAEGTILAVALNILHGNPIYPAPGPFPIVLAPYGPVTYLLVALLLKTFGVSLIWPRLLILCSTLGSSALVLGITRAFGGRASAGAVFGAAFFCSPIVWIWLPLVRIDFVAVTLALSGLCVFGRRGHRLALAAVLFVAAVMTKQSAIAAPMACCIELLVERRWRDCLRFVAYLGGLGALALLMLGPNAAFHLVLLGYRDVSSAVRYAQALTAVMAGSFILVLAVIYGTTVAGTRLKDVRLIWLYLGVATLTTLTAGKTGAETNHFLEWLAALSCVGAVSFSGPPLALDRGARLVLTGVVVFTLASAIGVQWIPRRDINQQGCQAAYDLIAHAPGQHILSEDVAAPALTGRVVAVTDPFAYALTKHELWEDGGLEARVQNGYFDLIVVGADSLREHHPQPRWTGEVARLVRTRYRVAQTFQCSPALGVAYVRAGDPPTAE